VVAVLFWEKPGCVNNARQKRLLRSAGHTVEARDLLTETWTPAALRPFFGELPVPDWFNRSAPAVKEGRVNPALLSEAEALAWMVVEPLLIRRPLMQAGDRRMAGFNPSEVEDWLGLGELAPDDLEQCPRERAAIDTSCGGHG
jgi:nitrogenase-associated protein